MCDVVCVMWCKAETKKNKNKKNKNKKTNKIKTRFELDSSRQHPRREQTGKKKREKRGRREGERHHQNDHNQVHASSLIMPRTHLPLQPRDVGVKLLDAGIKRFALIE